MDDRRPDKPFGSFGSPRVSLLNIVFTLCSHQIKYDDDAGQQVFNTFSSYCFSSIYSCLLLFASTLHSCILLLLL